MQTASTINLESHTSACRPLLKWPGGKRSELSRILPEVPKHERYFEPFFGGGSVFFDHVSVPSYANDVHSDLMKFYECVKHQNRRFFTVLYSHLDEWEQGSFEKRNEMYYECRERYNSGKRTSVCKAVDFFLLRELAYGGMFRNNSSGDFNVPFGKSYAKSKNLREKVQYLNNRAVVEKLNLLNLYSLDFEEFLKKFSFNSSDFMFVDPPYDSPFKTYDQQSFNELDQQRLASLLYKFDGKFMLVCKRTKLVEQLYENHSFSIKQYETKYKFNIKGRFSRSSTHVMVANYELN